MTFENYVFGREEFVEITNPVNGCSCVVKAKIDTESYTSNIDAEIASHLDLSIQEEPRRVYNQLGDEMLPVSSCNLLFNTGDSKGNVLDTEVTISDRSKLRHKLAIGRKDLERLQVLIDVNKSL